MNKSAEEVFLDPLSVTKEASHFHHQFHATEVISFHFLNVDIGPFARSFSLVQDKFIVCYVF